MTRDDLYDFLRSERFAVLATSGPTGPEAAIMGVTVTESLELVFLTGRTTRKYANLRAEPRVALVLGSTEETTVQYEGIAREVAGDALAPYAAAHAERFPAGRALAARPDATYFVVTPRWVRHSNYAGREASVVEFTYPR
jgi:hypothetical protein